MSAVPVFTPQFAPQPARRHLSARYDERAGRVLWLTMPEREDGSAPYFSPVLLEELGGVLQSMKQQGVAWPLAGELRPVHYAVLKSAHPDYFSLGGDLAHFHDCIRRRDRGALHDYSLRCADLLFDWSTLLGQQATTVALVQGRALGGGFETALAADYLIAEEHSEFGFPEILFGLFPCTGGMSLLAQRVGARTAEKMLGDGRIYTAQALKDLGVVDEICAKGEGEIAVEKFIASHSRQRAARLMLQRSRHRVAPLDRAELHRVVDEWTELAMNLAPQELRVMEMLFKMQRSRPAAAA